MARGSFSIKSLFFLCEIQTASAYTALIMKQTLYSNANLFTPEGTFRRGNLLVRGDRISGVHDESFATGEEATEIINLTGRYLLPGFIDAHFHIRSLALKSLRCDLYGAGSATEALELLSQWPGRRDSAVLVGVDWDESRWKDMRFPTRDMLDRLEPDRPVFLRRICGHVAVVNTAFAQRLEAEGVSVDKDTGVIEEDAVWTAGKLSAPDEADIVTSFDGAITQLHRLGITGVHDIIEAEQFDLYLEGIRSAKHPIRIKGYIPTAPKKLGGYREAAASMDKEFFEIKGVKIFLDGSIGGWTAALNEPYEDSPRKGELLMSRGKLKRILDECHEQGDDCAVHTIGDRALRTALELLIEYPTAPRVFRIEHAEIIGPHEMELLEKAPVYIAMQPNFIRNWGVPGGLYEKRLGLERLKYCNRFRSLKERGIGYCFSSDGMPPGPLYGLKGATKHPVPEERIPPGEALLRYTSWAQKLSCSPAGFGYLQQGSPADFIILSDNPLEEDPDELKVLQTFIAGRCMYEDNAV
jgi:predicted amidohydrolase YtcJ